MSTLAPLEMIPHIVKALEAVKDVPVEQQQAVLEAAAAGARAAVELRQRLYMAGVIVNKIGKP